MEMWSLSISLRGEAGHQVRMGLFGVLALHLSISVTLRTWWWQSSGKVTSSSEDEDEDVLFPFQLEGGRRLLQREPGTAVPINSVFVFVGFCCPPQWVNVTASLTQELWDRDKMLHKQNWSLCLLCPRYNLLPRIIEAKYLDAMDAEYWVSPACRAAGTALGASQGLGPSLQLPFTTFFVLWHWQCTPVTAPRGLCQTKGALDWEDAALWSCQAKELYGKCFFPHPQSTPTPKISLTAWLEHPELACVPLFEGGGDFLMHHILFFPNTKNRPLFYRMTALAWPLKFQSPVHPVFPNWCSGWDGLLLNHWWQQRWWLFSHIHGFGNSCNVYCYNPQFWMNF